jgi:hypothetical protein
VKKVKSKRLISRNKRCKYKIKIHKIRKEKNSQVLIWYKDWPKYN